MKNRRRAFLKNAASLSGAALALPPLLSAMTKEDGTADGNGQDFVFLFQGDSITDGNRSRNNDWNHTMGHGYAYLIASRLWCDRPEKRFHFFNRGVSGNKVPDLSQRWQTDTLDIKPNLLSILVGINDASVAIGGNKDFTIGQYEEGYRSLLQKTKEQLPDNQFVLCEPFVLPVDKVKEKWDEYQKETRDRQAVVRRLSDEYNATRCRGDMS